MKFSLDRPLQFVLGGVGVFLVALFVIGFEVKETRALYQKAQEHADQLAATLLDQESFKRAREALVETREARTAISSYFTTDEDAVLFIEEIESLGRLAGVVPTLASIDIVAGPPARLVLSVRAEGVWQNIQYYLLLLESMPRRLVVDKVTLSEIPADAKIKRWRAVYDLTLWSFQK